MRLLVIVFSIFGVSDCFFFSTIDYYLRKFANSRTSKFFFSGLYTGYDIDGPESDFDLSYIYNPSKFEKKKVRSDKDEEKMMQNMTDFGMIDITSSCE